MNNNHLKRIAAGLPLSLLSNLIINPFAAYTSLVPVGIITGVLGIQTGYQNIIKLVGLLFNKPFDDLGMLELVTVFLAFIYILSLGWRALKSYLDKHFGIQFEFHIVYVLISMSVFYGVAMAMEYFFQSRDLGSTQFLFVFYLFNMFALYSMSIISRARSEIKDKFGSDLQA